MIKFVENIQFVQFDQLKAVAAPANIEEIADTKELIQLVRGKVNTNKTVFAAFQELFNGLQRSPRAEVAAIILGDALLERSLEQQNYFINAVLGGFKLLNDSAKADKIFVDGRNHESYKLIDSLINCTTPAGFDPYYKFSESGEFTCLIPYENEKNLILTSLDVILTDELDKDTVASIFKHAFCIQHPTHQQSSLRSLMATFYRLEDRVTQSCLVTKLSHINNYNTYLSYV